MDLQLSDKTALISGSHRGTGAVIARALSAEGASVILHSDIEGACDALAEELDADAVWGNLSSDEGCDLVLQQLHRIGEVDILINNRGGSDGGDWSDDTEQWLAAYQHNVLSAVRLCQALAPDMQTRGWGRIVQLGTIGSRKPRAAMPHYYAAKAALANTTVSLCRELAGSGVTVNTVSPGYVRTPEVEAWVRRWARKRGLEGDWGDIVAAFCEAEYPNPCGRIGECEEIADLVCFLCSERAGFINGQNLMIDGGALASC